MKQGKKTAIDTPSPDDQLLRDLTRSITREDEAINDYVADRQCRDV